MASKEFSNNFIIDIEKTPSIDHHEMKNLFLECFLQQYSV